MNMLKTDTIGAVHSSNSKGTKDGNVETWVPLHRVCDQKVLKDPLFSL